jgi:biopolymer transport protein ExbD
VFDMAMSVGLPVTTTMTDVDHQHDAARRRDARAPDHLPDHDPRDHQDGEGELPKAANIATQTKPENITIAIDSQGNVYWNNGRSLTATELLERIKVEAVKVPQPEIHIRGDAQCSLRRCRPVLIYNIQRGGIVKVGFITEPDRGIRAAAN